MSSILVVDDDEHFRGFLRETLESAGYQIMEASNGVEATNLYRNTQADVIVLDMFMPEMDGLETMKVLLQEYSEVKIIAMSGGGQRPELAIPILNIASSLGALHILKKPFNLQELVQVVQELHPPDFHSQS